MSTPKTPLAGLKVVSMAEQYPGPFCTMTLSDLGAEVVQVERPTSGDPARHFKAFYEAINRGKSSVTLDVKESEQRDQLLSLLAEIDVFLEGFRPNKLAKAGLSYEDVKARNPRIIYCSISGFGQSGPYRDRPAHDLTYQGVAGALDERINGDVTGLPSTFLLGDTLSALYATVGILTALNARERTGEGTYIDVSMTDCVASAMAAFTAMSDQDDGIAPPQAEPAFDLFQCKDGQWLTLSIAHEDQYWKTLCETLGLDHVATLNRAERVARRGELKGMIEDRIAQEPRDALESVFNNSGQMWGPANRLHEAPHDKGLMARNLYHRVKRLDGVEQWVTRQPLVFSNYENAPLTPAPQLGADNKKILGET